MASVRVSSAGNDPIRDVPVERGWTLRDFLSAPTTPEKIRVWCNWNDQSSAKKCSYRFNGVSLDLEENPTLELTTDFSDNTLNINSKQKGN